MNTPISFLNGEFLPKEKIHISPDDRGFLFADGIYEVIRWYEGFFYDMEGHIIRMKRSLSELNIAWNGSDELPSIAEKLIKLNSLDNVPAMVYIQITRGAAKRTHFFPDPLTTTPTSYAFAWGFTPDRKIKEEGISVIMKADIRWSRCDIKSVSLLANTLNFNEAWQKGKKECIFSRNGVITEASHSNVFFVLNNELITHPESNYILSGITRRNILRIARENGIKIREEALPSDSISKVQEAFISNTSSEVTPVTMIDETLIGNGLPGPVTVLIREKFDAEISYLRGR